MKNFYIILGVPNTADLETIKAAYRALAKKFHPDKNLGDRIAEERFKEIQEAYTVLSNPEKRKKYDLKFSYGTTQKSRQNNSNPYTGNAYQYAQQQAQQKQQQAYQQRSPKEEKIDKSENYYILVSVGIAMILLYFIISYSSVTEAPVIPAGPGSKVNVSVPQLSTEPVIEDFDSPYSSFFGEEVDDPSSKNSLYINNVSGKESVVCLVENKEPHRTIRHYYLNSGTNVKMNNVPDGEYFLKVYYGYSWDTTKTFGIDNIKGGFTEDRGFIQLNTGKNTFKMKQQNNGSSISYSSYDINLVPYKDSLGKTVTAREFFK